MKKILVLMLALLMSISVFFACGNEPTADDDKDDPKETTEAEAEKDANADDKDSASTEEDKDENDGSKEDEKPCTHTYDNACDTECNTCKATRTVTHAYAETLTKGETTHWYACSVCGDKKDEAAHVFDKSVDSSEYLKAEATATTKAQYWKSCVCGAKSATEYFESNKQTSTLNVTMAGKTYDGTPVAAPVYTTNSSGSVTIEWYSGNDKLASAPSNAGTYKVKVIVAENDDYTGISAEKEFTIAKAQTVLSTVAMSSVNIKYGDSYSVNYFLTGDGEVAVQYKVKDADDSTYTVDAPVLVGNYTVRLTVAESANYLGCSETFDFDITPVTLSGINATVEYNGENIHEIDLSDWGYNGVMLKVTFDSENVDANISEVSVLENEEATDNYTIDEVTCTVSIVKKTLGVQWTAPVSLDFDGEEKVPTVILIGLVAGDDCSAEIEKDGDNVWFGETFKYRIFSLTGTDADNYSLPDNVYSPNYTITIHDSVALGEAADVGATSWYDNTTPYTMYYSIDLDAGYYYFDYTSVNQGVSFVFELYAKGDTSTPIATYEVDEYSTTSVAFEIETAGTYYVKVVSEDEGQSEELTIRQDTHESKDSYGFCERGCGTYLGEELNTNEYYGVTIKRGEKVYYRFKKDPDNFFNIKCVDKPSSVTITCYRVNDGVYTVQELTGTGTKLGDSDGYYYLVIEYGGVTPQEFQFQIEKSSF